MVVVGVSAGVEHAWQGLPGAQADAEDDRSQHRERGRREQQPAEPGGANNAGAQHVRALIALACGQDRGEEAARSHTEDQGRRGSPRRRVGASGPMDAGLRGDSHRGQHSRADGDADREPPGATRCLGHTATSAATIAKSTPIDSA